MYEPILAPLTFLTYSLGCRTNQAEMEEISLQLIANGLPQIDGSLLTDYRLQQPDLVLLNTCVVTQKAEKETRQKIRELRKKYPKSFLVVLGCGVTAKDKFKINLPEADLYIPNSKKQSVIKLLKKQFILGKKNNRNFLDNKYIQSGRKFIKIQDGCDKFCSFCLTCHLRGKLTSVPPNKIIEEINYWVSRGIKEAILTGINLELYESHISLISLIRKILSETRIERISFSSIYPEMLLQQTGIIPVCEFTKLVVNNSRISQDFHLSLQSGSSTVLKRMNRKTDLNKLKQTLSEIKGQNPLFSLRADIITGFPNETEEEFQETLDFIKETKISFVHSFHFSVRPDTQAEEFIRSGKWKEIPSIIKKQRAERLKSVVEEIRREETKKMIGIRTNCLIVKLLNCSPCETSAKRGYLVEGLTENGWPIRISIMYPSSAKTTAGKQVLSIKYKELRIKGKILPVKITGYEENYLLGEIVSLPTY